MKSVISIRSALLGIVATFALASAAQAGVARTWVGSAGNDSNTATNCARTAPCKTFAAAYSVTQAGGEIIALDSVGYGPLTVTTALRIIGLEGALVSVQTGTVGMTISAGASDVVLLRNIQFSGAAGSSNTKGIQLSSGHLVLQESSLRGLTTGLVVNSSHAFVDHTDFVGNGTAILTTGTGVDTSTFPQNGTTWVLLNWGSVLFNTTAFFQTDPGANKYPIMSTSIGNSITTYIQGNPTFSTGSGASCSGWCTGITNFLQQSQQDMP